MGKITLCVVQIPQLWWTRRDIYQDFGFTPHCHRWRAGQGAGQGPGQELVVKNPLQIWNRYQQEDVFLRNDSHLAKFKEHHRRQISFLAIWNENTYQADMYAMQAYMQLNSYHLPLQVPMKTLFTAVFKKIISFSIRYECVYRAFIRAICTQRHSLHLVLRQSASSLPIYLI